MAFLADLLRVAPVVVPSWGALAFGAVMGWIAYRTLRFMETKPTWQDLATIAATLLGATITTIFRDPTVFGAYCIGLAVGFFAYLLVSHRAQEAWKKRAAAQYARDKTLPPDPPASLDVSRWMGERESLPVGQSPPKRER